MALVLQSIDQGRSLRIHSSCDLPSQLLAECLGQGDPRRRVKVLRGYAVLVSRPCGNVFKSSWGGRVEESNLPSHRNHRAEI